MLVFAWSVGWAGVAHAAVVDEHAAVLPAFPIDALPDADGDGFVAPADCDDRDAAVHPTAIERCAAYCGPDGRDDDCDGRIDEGCPEVVGGDLFGAEVWGAGERVVAACGVTVWDVLTVEDGATVAFDSGAALVVRGRLDVRGADATDPSASRVVFTSARATPRPGDWRGVVVIGEAHVVGLDVRWAGRRGGSGIAFSGAALAVDRSWIRDGAGPGITVTGPAAIRATNVTDNGGGGVSIATAATVVLDDVVVAGNRNAGIVVGTDAPRLRLDRVVATANAGSPLDLATGTALAGIGEGNHFAGNAVDRVLVRRDTIVHTDAVWGGVDVPVELLGHAVDVRARLVLSGGLELRGGSLVGLRPGSALDLTGSAARPVVLRDVAVVLRAAAPSGWAWAEVTGESAVSALDTELAIVGLDAHDVTPPSTGPDPDPKAFLLLGEGGSVRLSSFDRVGSFGAAVYLENARELSACTFDGFAPPSPSGAAVLAVHLGPVPGPTVIRDVTWTDIGGTALSVASYEPEPVVVASVRVDGAVGRGIDVVGARGNVTLDDVTVTGVRRAHLDDRFGDGAGLYLAGDGPVSARNTRLTLTDNELPVAAETLGAADGLARGAFVGNRVDAVVVRASAVGSAVALGDVGVPFRAPGPIVVGPGGTLSLDGATLVGVGGGVIVDRGGQLFGRGCTLTGEGAQTAGVTVGADSANVASLVTCEVSGFGGSGVAFGWTLRATPAVALIGSSVFGNGRYGVLCDGPGGCVQYEIDTGRPILAGANLVFDDPWGAYGP